LRFNLVIYQESVHVCLHSHKTALIPQTEGHDT